MGGPRKIETFVEENLHFDDSPKYGDDLYLFLYDGLGFANRNTAKILSHGELEQLCNLNALVQVTINSTKSSIKLPQIQT